MLVLSRKNSESVVVGSADGLERLVKVTVLEIGPAMVRLGFEAETHVPVHREELWQQMHPAGQRDPPAVNRGRSKLRDGTGKKKVLSGEGNGWSL